MKSTLLNNSPDLLVELERLLAGHDLREGEVLPVARIRLHGHGAAQAVPGVLHVTGLDLGI